MTPEETAASLRDWRESFFQFAPDSPTVHATWQRLVSDFGVCGKQVHDAAIVAAAKSASADQVLTFNREHFQRFEREIVIRTPQEIILGQELQHSRERGHDIER